jgi:hypothetical protein
MTAPAIVTIAVDFDVTIQKIALVTGYQLLVTGAMGYHPPSFL